MGGKRSKTQSRSRSKRRRIPPGERFRIAERQGADYERAKQMAQKRKEKNEQKNKNGRRAQAEHQPSVSIQTEQGREKQRRE